MRKKFNNKDIKGKIKTGFTIVIVLMLVSGLLSMFSLYKLHDSFNDFANRTNRADTAVKICRIDINIAARNIREMALCNDVASYAEYKATVEEKLTAMNDELAALKETGVIPDEQRQAYVDAITAWATTGYEIMGLIEAGDSNQAISRIFNECVPALDKIVQMSQELDELTDELMEESLAMSELVFWLAAGTIVVFIILAITTSIAVQKVIIKSITEPLSEIERVAANLAEGNLHTTIEYRGTDEIGHLAHSLRKSLRTIGSYVDDVSRIMQEFSNGNFAAEPEVEWQGDFVAIHDSLMTFEKSMADTISGIQGVAAQVSSGAEQVSDSSMELAEGATEQASITEELSATIESASEEMALSANAAKNVSAKMVDSEKAITRSNEKMQEMVTSMGEISEASQKIRQIIDSINNIAAQTNLLALNASIEAARAGVAGKGFAAVADQVSILAAQSADAAKESNVLIESSLAAVDKGLMIAEETAKQLEEVVEESRRITGDVNHAAEAITAQADSFKQIITGVDHINDVVQTNSATSQECAAASEEMSSQAELLENLVKEFKIKEA